TRNPYPIYKFSIAQGFYRFVFHDIIGQIRHGNDQISDMAFSQFKLFRGNAVFDKFFKVITLTKGAFAACHLPQYINQIYRYILAFPLVFNLKGIDIKNTVLIDLGVKFVEFINFSCCEMWQEQTFSGGPYKNVVFSLLNPHQVFGNATSISAFTSAA